MKREKGETAGAQPRRETLRSIKFLLFSVSAGLIQIVSFTLFKEVFGLVYWQSYLFSLILSVLWNFTLNRRYTFQSAANIPKAMALVALFYCVFTPLSTWAGDALARRNVNEYLIEGGTMLVNFVLEFLYQRFIVFRTTIDTNDLAKREAHKK